MTDLKKKIIEEVKKIYDPEIPVNIYALGLIYDVQVSEDCDVNITMTLTSPNCPVAETLPVEIEEKVTEAVTILGLEDLRKRKPSQLSGGQRQRVAMGRAIVRRPDAFLFDEPLSNLDAKLRTQMRTEIKKLHQKLKTTVIYVTHDQVEAMTLADRIIIMREGFIEQIGSPIEVFNKPVNVFVATFIGSPPMNVIECEVVSQNENLFIKIDNDVLMPCPPTKQDKLKKSSKVFVGIRAEDIVPSENSTGVEKKGWNFEKSIELAEPLGTETQLFFKLNDKEVISRMYNPRVIELGEKIKFEVDLEKIHLFDHETEKAI